jgi:hypothetical protein
MRSSLTVRGETALAANFHKLRDLSLEKVIAAQAENGAEHRQRMYDEAPKDTHFMAEHTEVRFSEGGYTYEAGYWPDPFLAAGLPFYPPFVALGTSKQQANDWIFRATEPMREIAKRRVGDAIKDAIAEVSE